MNAEPMEFVVTDNPPWYQEAKRDARLFTCAHTEGLLEQVARVMAEKTANAAAKCKAFQHKTVRKLVRDMVIEDIHAFKQKPSKDLLFALMDLVDIQGGELECMSTEDRAGMKQLMVALRNYTLFYIPSKALNSSRDNRIVVPVVTLWDHTNTDLELRFCDEVRSMLATYTVNLASGSAVYFMQQVLAVPGVQSLRLLETVAGDRYRFWDMSLEVPTHADALTPFFKQIKPHQLLRVEDKEQSPSAAQDGSGNQDSGEAVEPMCCVLDKESAGLQNRMRQGSVDCFSDADVVCDLSRFTCKAPVEKTVYFRRTGRVLGRTRGNLIAVVSLRESQRTKQRLYVSTTARFCRALVYSCVKGSGELLKCCHTKINELACRETFLTGSELHQDIINSAVTAFAKRVSPPANNWCNYTPKHVACLIKNPIMSDIVDLGTRLMDAKIPNAFMVAELLLSSTKTANRHLQAQACYAKDKACRVQICKNNIANLEKQFKVDLDTLIGMSSKIATSKAQKTAVKELFRNLSSNNINDTFKQWQQMVKQPQQPAKDKPAAKEQSNAVTKKQSNALAKEHINVKVLFYNLRVYLAKINKLKKIVKTQEVASSSSSGSSSATEAADKSSGSPKPKEDSDPFVSPVSPSEKPWYLSMIIPDNPPLGTWVRNIGTLLQSASWLYADNTRREAVCSVLGLDKNAVCKKHTSVLKQWVFNNLTVVDQLKQQGLDDTLSSALIKISDSMSHGSWIKNVERAFIRKKATGGINPHKYSVDKKPKRKPDVNRKPTKPNKKISRRNVVEEFFCQEASSGEEYEEDTDQLEDEEHVYGEDLSNKEDYDRRELLGEYDKRDKDDDDDEEDDDDDDDDDEEEKDEDGKNLDEYDLSDDFIDDRSEYSVEESDQDTPRPKNRRKRRRVIEHDDSDTDLDPGYSDDDRVPAKITKRRITKYDDDDDDDEDDINAHKPTAAKSERKAVKPKKLQIRFSRPGVKKEHPREKASVSRSSDCAAKKPGKQRSKTRHGSGDRKCEKRSRIYSDSDSSDDDERPSAKRPPPNIKHRTQKISPVEDTVSADGTAEPPASPAAESAADPEDSSDFFGHIVTM